MLGHSCNETARATSVRGVLADVCHSPGAAEKRTSIHVGEVAIADDLQFHKWWLQFDRGIVV